MFLEQRLNFFNPQPFNQPTNTILGQTQKWSIDRTYPIEEILVFVNFDVTTGLTTTAPTTMDMFDNILSIVQRINLTTNDGRQPRTVVDLSGPAALEYASQVGLNLDEATMRLVAISGNPVGALAVPVGAYQMCYRIPCVNPMIADPMRTRMYLPVHTYPQDPTLTLTFNTLAQMLGGTPTGVIGTVRVDVVLVRRVPTQASEALLRSSAGSNPNGYIDWDLIETQFTVPLGTATEQRFPIPVPGNYVNMLFRQYKGGANYSRNVPVDVDVGDTIANNLGNETRWRLESANQVLREWRWKHLRTMNDFTRPTNVLGPLLTAPTLPTPRNQGFVAVASAGSPTINLTNQTANFPTSLQAAIANYRAGTSCLLDFLGDGLTNAGGNELGSLLDCNTPANNGLKMELIGTPASVATFPSVISVVGLRLFGDISRWQKF